MIFKDRAEAGRRLGAELAKLALPDPVVYALPRGGVPVAAEVARALDAPLDLMLVRKIGAPGSPELALGALTDGDAPEIVFNEDVRRVSGADDAYIARKTAEELAELERRRRAYLGDRPGIDPRGRTAIVVDDGLATGATMKAALIALRRRGAAEVCIAVPVAPEDRLDEIGKLADRTICLSPEKIFYGVGQFYEDFHQLTDDETVALLDRFWRHAPD